MDHHVSCAFHRGRSARDQSALLVALTVALKRVSSGASTGTAGNASINLRMTPELHPSAGNNLFAFSLLESE